MYSAYAIIKVIIGNTMSKTRSISSPPVNPKATATLHVPTDFPSKIVPITSKANGIVRHKPGCGSVGHAGACVVAGLGA